MLSRMGDPGDEMQRSMQDLEAGNWSKPDLFPAVKVGSASVRPRRRRTSGLFD